jgi:hypothetical protein
MATGPLLLPLLRQYIVRPCKDAPAEVREFACRLFCFPADFEVKSLHAFDTRRRELLDLVQGSSSADPHQLDSFYALQCFVESCPLGLDKQGKQSYNKKVSELLGTDWDSWDHAGLWLKLERSSNRGKIADASSKGRFCLLDRVIAVELLRDLLETEYQEAVEMLGVDSEGVPQNSLMTFPHGTYSWVALGRIYYVLDKMMLSNPIQAWNFISCNQLLPWENDVSCLKKFSEAILARAHVWCCSRDAELVRETKKQLGQLRSLSIHGKVSTPENCAATVNLLRFFFRSTIKYHYSAEPDSSFRQTSLALTESAQLSELQCFEEELFRPQYPSNDFSQRLPALLLGKAWGVVYLHLKGLQERGVVQHEDLLGPSFDQAKLLYYLPEDKRETVESLLSNMQSLYKDTLEDCASRKGLSKACACLILDLLQFEAENVRAVWKDERALEVLLNLSRNQKRFSFLPPFFYGLRFEQLHRELPFPGSVLLFWQAIPGSHERILEHPIKTPFEVRVLEENHPFIFKSLPLGSAELKLAGEDSLLAAVGRYSFFCSDMGFFTEKTRKHLLSGNCKILPSAPRARGSQYLTKDLVEALRKADSARFLETLTSLPEILVPRSKLQLRMERIRAVLFSSDDKLVASMNCRAIMVIHPDQSRRKDLLKGLSDAEVPIFLEEKNDGKIFYKKLKGDGSFYPCYSTGVTILDDWSPREQEILHDSLKDAGLKKKADLLLHGAKSVLFSDAPSGILREEKVCRLPLVYSKKNKLVSLLQKKGVALYFWSINRSFKPLADVRFLELELLFDESENLYDWGSLYRKTPEDRQAVKDHVLRCLQKLAPSEDCFLWTRGVSRALLVLTRGQVPVSQHLSLVKSLSVLSLGEEAPQPVSFVSVHESRSFAETCLGSKGCARRACREVRGLCVPVVCEVCDAWEALEKGSNEVCQYLLQLGTSCSAKATKRLKGSEQAYPRFICENHAVLDVVPPEDLRRCHSRERGALLWREMPASLGIRREGTYPTSYSRKEDSKAPIFPDPLVLDDCLEVQCFLKQALVRWLSGQTLTFLTAEKLLLSLDDRTKDILDACIAEAYPASSCLPLTYSLESHQGKKRDVSLLHLLGSQQLLEYLEEDAANVSSVGGLGSRSLERQGEIPLSLNEAEEKGLQKEASTCRSIVSYCERKGLLLSRKPEEKKDVLGIIHSYISLADCFFNSSGATVLQVFEKSLPGHKKQRWSEQVTLGWFLAFQALAAIEKASKKKDRKGEASTWLTYLQTEFQKRKLFLRTQAAWKIIGSLPSLLLEGGPRSTVARILSSHLLFNEDLTVAPQQLKNTEEALRELYELHRLRSSVVIAQGMLQSCLASLEESLQASGRSFVTPLEFLRYIVLPRVKEAEEFEQVVEMLFSTTSKPSVKPRPEVREVTKVAQAFFWSPWSKKRLRDLSKELEARFADAKLPTLQQKKRLGRCFTAETTESKRGNGNQKKQLQTPHLKKSCTASKLIAGMEALARQLESKPSEGSKATEASSKKRKRALSE